MKVRKMILLVICMLLLVQPVQIWAAGQSSIVGQQLFLGDDLNLHFYAEISDDHLQDGVMTVAVGETTVANYTVNQMTPNADGYYAFSVNLGAPEMTENVTLTLISDGIAVLQKTYSVCQYAQYLLDGNYNEETKNLVLQMLNYGAKAQLYFEHRTDDLANAGNVVQPDYQIPTRMPEIAIAGSVTGARYYGSTMLFRSETAMRYYFAVTGNVGDYTFAVDGKTYQPVAKGDYYYIEVADINPQEMETAMDVSVTNGAENMSFSYRPMDYIIRMYNKAGTSQKMKDMLFAANGYFQSAKVFAGVKAPMPVLQVSDAAAKAGDEITVTVDIAHNPGLLGTKMTLSYDENVMTLTNATNGSALSGLNYMKPSRLKSGCNFLWYGSAPSAAQDGTVLTLTFTVAEDAPAGSYSVDLVCLESDTFDGQNEPLAMDVRCGTVTVS